MAIFLWKLKMKTKRHRCWAASVFVIFVSVRWNVETDLLCISIILWYRDSKFTDFVISPIVLFLWSRPWLLCTTYWHPSSLCKGRIPDSVRRKIDFWMRRKIDDESKNKIIKKHAEFMYFFECQPIVHVVEINVCFCAHESLACVAVSSLCPWVLRMCMCAGVSNKCR